MRLLIGWWRLLKRSAITITTITTITTAIDGGVRIDYKPTRACRTIKSIFLKITVSECYGRSALFCWWWQMKCVRSKVERDKMMMSEFQWKWKWKQAPRTQRTQRTAQRSRKSSRFDAYLGTPIATTTSSSSWWTTTRLFDRRRSNRRNFPRDIRVGRWRIRR